MASCRRNPYRTTTVVRGGVQGARVSTYSCCVLLHRYFTTHTYLTTYRILLPYLYLHLEVSTIYISNIHPSFPNTCISCVKRQYPSRTLKLSHIELCQYCRGGPDGKPGSCIPFSFFIHSTMDRAPEDGPRLESVEVVHTLVFFWLHVN